MEMLVFWAEVEESRRRANDSRKRVGRDAGKALRRG
jgi:hypothetical protein